MHDAVPRPLERRAFLKLAAFAGAAAAVPRAFVAHAEPAGEPTAVPDGFPRQAADVVREVVGASHGNFDRVRELVVARPALAKAVWDWGYGDWESALGAASHVGRRDIAEYLISMGARPNVFSAAMLGQLDVVRAFVAADAGTPAIAGPHGIPLIAHARAGGEAAKPVLAYLESLGAAPERPPDPDDAERAAVAGRYAFGPGAADRFEVKDADGRLTLAREGHPARGLARIERGVFHPAGAPAVRVTFAFDGGRAGSLTVQDGPLRITAGRDGGS